MSTRELNNNSIDGEQYLRELTKSFTGIEKPLKNVKTPATLDELISELHEVFKSDRVNIEYVNHLLLSYQSNPAEWKKFAKFDRYKWVKSFSSLFINTSSRSICFSKKSHFIVQSIAIYQLLAHSTYN